MSRWGRPAALAFGALLMLFGLLEQVRPDLAIGLLSPWARPGMAPIILGMILVLATVFERRYRGAPTSRDAPAPGWEATGETFRDEENGKWVRVWFHPASGERRYVATDSPRP